MMKATASLNYDDTSEPYGGDDFLDDDNDGGVDDDVDVADEDEGEREDDYVRQRR